MAIREAKALVCESWKHGRRAMGTPVGPASDAGLLPLEVLEVSMVLWVFGETGDGEAGGGGLGCGGGVVM